MDADIDNASPPRAREPVPREGPIVVREFTDTDAPAWSEFVTRHVEANLYHTLRWRQVIMEVFGHRPIYLLAARQERVCAVLPLSLIKFPRLPTKLGARRETAAITRPLRILLAGPATHMPNQVRQAPSMRNPGKRLLMTARVLLGAGRGSLRWRGHSGRSIKTRIGSSARRGGVCWSLYPGQFDCRFIPWIARATCFEMPMRRAVASTPYRLQPA